MLIHKTRRSAMSLEKGKTTFRVVLTGKHVIGDDLELALVARSYTTIPHVDEYKIEDVCRGRTLWGKTDEGLPEDFLRYGSNLYFSLRTRENKLNKKTLSEYIEFLIEKEITETGDNVSSKRRKAIKNEAQMTLMSLSAESLSGVRAISAIGGKSVIVEGGSAKSAERIQELLEDCVEDAEVSMLTPDFLYYLSSSETDLYQPFRISEEHSSDVSIGADFLTWLWMASETVGVLPDAVAVALCGDITFKGCADDSVASVTTKLSKGSPWKGDEPMAAFSGGKKVSSAKFRFSKNLGQTYEVSIDDTFKFSSFDVVDGKEDGLDVQSEMNEKVTSITEFLTLLTSLFYKFKALGDKNESLIATWVKNRWQFQSDDSDYSVVGSSGEELGKINLLEEMSKSSSLSNILDFMVRQIPGVAEQVVSIDRPAVIINKSIKQICVIDVSQISELTQ
jgi:hypothetical protein